MQSGANSFEPAQAAPGFEINAEPSTFVLERLQAICARFQDNSQRLERIEQRLNDRDDTGANKGRPVFYGVELGKLQISIDQLSACIGQMEKRLDGRTAPKQAAPQ